jgi:hypothetical protein
MDPPEFTYRCHNGKGFVLTSDWPVLIEEGRLIVPKGFITDGASVPRLLWIIPGFGNEELGMSGPTAHDAVYQGIIGRDCPKLTRCRTDQLFRTLMRTDGVGKIRACVAWAAVRLFGWLAWRRMPARDRALWMAS